MSQATQSKFASSQRKGLIGIRDAKDTCVPLSKRLLINYVSLQKGLTSICLADQVWMSSARKCGL